MLKKAVAILLIALYLITTTELDQLMKLPVLVEHYIEHKEQNNNITLWHFLCMHYADTEHHTHTGAGGDADNKLPFKSHDNCLSVSFSMYVAEISDGFVFAPAIISLGKPFEHYGNFLPTSCASNIWQPPRCC